MKNKTQDIIGKQDLYYVNYHMFKGKERKIQKHVKKKEKITIVKL